MSARMKLIKARLKAEKEARRLAGGQWERRGECKRCGTCCNIMLVAPDEYEKIQADARARGLIPSVANLDPRCQNYKRMPDGRMGCVLHETGRYPSGCEAFPAKPEHWYRVAGSCGYEFIWVEDRPRVHGKRRARA